MGAVSAGATKGVVVARGKGVVHRDHSAGNRLPRRVEGELDGNGVQEGKLLPLLGEHHVPSLAVVRLAKRVHGLHVHGGDLDFLARVPYGLAEVGRDVVVDRVDGFRLPAPLALGDVEEFVLVRRAGHPAPEVLEVVVAGRAPQNDLVQELELRVQGIDLGRVATVFPVLSPERVVELWAHALESLQRRVVRQLLRRGVVDNVGRSREGLA